MKWIQPTQGNGNIKNQGSFGIGRHYLQGCWATNGDSARNRDEWRRCKEYFIFEALNVLLGSNHRAFGVFAAERPTLDRSTNACEQEPAAQAEALDPGPMSHYNFANVKLARAMLRKASASLRAGIVLQIVGDSRILVDCLLGRAVPAQQWLKALRMAHSGLQTLTSSFGVSPPTGRAMCQQVPRADNSAADQAANRALDHGNFREICSHALVGWIGKLTGDAPEACGLLFSFEGASRGNPGAAALGVCAWWGIWTREGFTEQGQLLRLGRQIGRDTNNVAETFGLARAIKEALHCLLHLAEFLAQQQAGFRLELGAS